jgi:hypothetical protein
MLCTLAQLETVPQVHFLSPRRNWAPRLRPPPAAFCTLAYCALATAQSTATGRPMTILPLASAMAFSAWALQVKATKPKPWLLPSGPRGILISQTKPALCSSLRSASSLTWGGGEGR